MHLSKSRKLQVLDLVRSMAADVVGNIARRLGPKSNVQPAIVRSTSGPPTKRTCEAAPTAIAFNNSSDSKTDGVGFSDG